jgi:hypothetical protein
MPFFIEPVELTVQVSVTKDAKGKIGWAIGNVLDRTTPGALADLGAGLGRTYRECMGSRGVIPMLRNGW